MFWHFLNAHSRSAETSRRLCVYRVNISVHVSLVWYLNFALCTVRKILKFHNTMMLLWRDIVSPSVELVVEYPLQPTIPAVTPTPILASHLLPSLATVATYIYAPCMQCARIHIRTLVVVLSCFTDVVKLVTVITVSCRQFSVFGITGNIEAMLRFCFYQLLWNCVCVCVCVCRLFNLHFQLNPIWTEN
jgi:hypothetical protein